VECPAAAAEVGQRTGTWPIAYAIDLLRQWRIITGMVFIETTVFTKQVGDMLSDDEYALLQEHLASDPTAGSVIQGTGGCAKYAGPRWEKENGAASA